ncbi:MAG: hypothetical protein KDJ86_09605 [Bauldia sp.]|nr:hypothetical protein [Bauldia sp.]
MFAAIPTASQAATTVKVSLWDKGADVEMPKGLLYGTPGVDLSKATMGIKLSTDTAPHGIVAFKVTNDSKDTIHEMIVLQLANPGQPLPYDEGTQRVDEEMAGDKGEVSELDPGQSGSLTLNLQAGEYLLICNVAGHYGAGMWTEFTVTP